MKRFLYLLAGSVFTMLGIIGIFVPLLPTVPFLLLASYCYARSSEKCYNRMLNNKWFGKIIRDYKERKCVPVKAKIFSFVLLWLTIGYSILYIVKVQIIIIVLIAVGIAVSVHLLMLRSY